MKTIVLAVAVILLLSGCATYDPVSSDYIGPLSTIEDSAVVHSSSKADLFYLARIDGKLIETSLSATIRANQGRGFMMDPVVESIVVPSRSTKFKIVGKTIYAAPILALSNTVYQVSGEVEFVPEPTKTYTVTGALGEDYSAVWIEERESGKVIGKKIEVTGSSKLQFWEK